MKEDVTYGIGGYNPVLPNSNIVKRLVDNGDGTGVLTDYSVTPPAVTPLSDLPIPEPEGDLVAVLNVLAAMPIEELQRVLALGVLLTEQSSVTALETAVAEAEPVQGVAVVAEAAALAANPTPG
jgi:hypothetical protein